MVGAAVLAPAAAAGVPSVTVVVEPPAAVRSHAADGALGLFVPGAGETITRQDTLKSLLAGHVVSSLAGEIKAPPVISLSTKPGVVTIHVALPAPGRHHNVVRYPIAIVGDGYRGILVSASTRIAGLVSIADVAPTALALTRRKPPVITSRGARGAAEIRALDRRLSRAHDSRAPATIALAVLLGTLIAAALLRRSSWIARAALLAAPSAVASSLILSAAKVWSPVAVGVCVACGGFVTALGLARRASLFAPFIGVFLVAFIAVLVMRPETNALASIGPHPDGGVRFFGITNQVETLLLAPVLAAAAMSRRWLVGIGLGGLIAFGWSRAGADGGGVLVLVAGLATLVMQASRAPVTSRTVTIAAVAGGVLAAILFGLDVLTGGSSHVTRALGGGPSTLGGDFWRRGHVTWGGATSSWHAVLLCAVGLAAIILFALRSAHHPTVAAMIAALAVSLIVNDSPVDELVWGALGCAGLWALEVANARPTKRSSARSARRVSPEPSLQRA